MLLITNATQIVEAASLAVPEFPVSAIVLASALAASLFILRRKRK